MYIERKQDLSVYYKIKDTFDAEGASFIEIVDEFPAEDLTIPSISIENHSYMVRPFELGNRTGLDIRKWYINIFANNKSQRDDYGYLIKNALQDGIPVYDYDEGFPPSVSPTQIGGLTVVELEVSPIRIFPELVSKLYWRGQIKLVAVYNQTT